MQLERNSLRDLVRDVLLGRILDGTYKSGDRLIALRIARELHTSQGPVREALREMEAMRLVESQPYRGTRVRDISAREMQGGAQVRGALEDLAAQLAGTKLRTNLGQLREEFNAILASAKSGDLNEYAKHNAQFHRIIVEASENPVLIHLWNCLRLEARTLVNLQASVDLVKLAESHQPILDALAQGDGEVAGRLLRQHATSVISADYSLDSLQSRLKGPGNSMLEQTEAVEGQTVAIGLTP